MNADYGQVIKQRRMQKGDTQQEFADKMGVTRGTVGNWERGEMPDYLPLLVTYLSDGPVSEKDQYQMLLPFGPASSIELRVSPQRADTIRFEVQLHEKAS